ncbi:hypothetical protein CALVIDRAFT_562241 [Calocera viscosa TUFC12733]|uniref:Uncharacterized protein n=1 Tax=Calocera viscosa (strain TUFC12733) TaxID=1330018 RepID=A0A167P1G6_CALVF|nr:hypothetical protein CALVIDRAFT_562241 [Calocera viscosa TUFC12733]
MQLLLALLPLALALPLTQRQLNLVATVDGLLGLTADVSADVTAEVGSTLGTVTSLVPALPDVDSLDSLLPRDILGGLLDSVTITLDSTLATVDGLLSPATDLTDALPLANTQDLTSLAGLKRDLQILPRDTLDALLLSAAAGSPLRDLLPLSTFESLPVLAEISGLVRRDILGGLLGEVEGTTDSVLAPVAGALGPVTDLTDSLPVGDLLDELTGGLPIRRDILGGLLGTVEGTADSALAPVAGALAPVTDLTDSLPIGDLLDELTGGLQIKRDILSGLLGTVEGTADSALAPVAGALAPVTDLTDALPVGDLLDELTGGLPIRRDILGGLLGTVEGTADSALAPVAGALAPVTDLTDSLPIGDLLDELTGGLPIKRDILGGLLGTVEGTADSALAPVAGALAPVTDLTDALPISDLLDELTGGLPIRRDILGGLLGTVEGTADSALAPVAGALAPVTDLTDALPVGDLLDELTGGLPAGL